MQGCLEWAKSSAPQAQFAQDPGKANKRRGDNGSSGSGDGGGRDAGVRLREDEGVVGVDVEYRMIISKG